MNLHTEEMVLNMGPHHPSTHGVIRLVLKLEGEVVTEAIPDVGYLHRAIEKIGEKVTYQGFMPYTDRIDYVAAINCNVGYALAVEKLSDVEVPGRATWLRMLGCELNRIASHMLGLGALAMDVGAYTPFTHGLRERESIFDLLERMTGARLTYNYARIGGVSRDIDDIFVTQLREYLDHLPRFLDEFMRLIGGNKIFVERLGNIGIVTPDEAKDYSFSGPNLRASGVRFDLRRAAPYMFYDQLDFSLPIGLGFVGTPGDSYDRYLVRIEEMRQSREMILQILERLEPGEILTKIGRRFVPPAGEIFYATEAPRGELGYYIVSDGEEQSPLRIKVRTGSFAALTSIEKKLPGLMIPDVIAYFASLDVVAPEVDR